MQNKHIPTQALSYSDSDEICPLLRVPCLGERCAWWANSSWRGDGCSLTVIAEIMNSIISYAVDAYEVLERTTGNS